MSKKQNLAKLLLGLMSDKQPFDISLDNDERISILNIKLTEDKYLVACTPLDIESRGWDCVLSDEKIDKNWLDRASANDCEWLEQTMESKLKEKEMSPTLKYLISGSCPGEPNLSLGQRVYNVITELAYPEMGIRWVDGGCSPQRVMDIAKAYRNYVKKLDKENNMAEQDR